MLIQFYGKASLGDSREEEKEDEEGEEDDDGIKEAAASYMRSCDAAPNLAVAKNGLLI